MSPGGRRSRGARARSRRCARWRRSTGVCRRAPSTTRPARGRRCTIWSARCSSRGLAREDAAGAVRLLEGGGERAELELVAGEVRALLDEGIGPRRSRSCTGRRARWRSCSGRCSPRRRSLMRCERRVRFANTAIGGALVGALRSTTDAGEVSRSAGVAARAGPAGTPRAGRSAGGAGAARGGEERGAGAGDLGGGALAAGGARPPGRGGAARRERRCASARRASWSGCSTPPGEGARRCWRATSWTRRALWRPGGARWRSWAGSRRAPRAGRRRGRAGDGCSRAWRSSAASGPGRAGWRWSIRWRCGRGGCGRCSCAGCRRACSPRARGRSRCWPRRSGGGWRKPLGCGWGEPAGGRAGGGAVRALRGGVAAGGAAGAELARGG